MLGNVERYVLTPVVLRFARKYIKNVEGAAATDLQVSLTGGSLIFRNFELNLEEVVKNLPCSVVRTFARELQIRIPWTRLATDPIEVILDTVECVFAKDKGPSAGPGAPAEQPAAYQEPGKGGDADSADLEAPGQTWVGSLLQSALANVTVRVKNSVIKYVTDGAVATVSVESMVACSAGKDWQQAFTDPLLGLRRACSFKSVSVCLDELDSFGRVAAYQEALIRTPSVTVRLSLNPARGVRKCETEVSVGPLNVSASSAQLEQLREIVGGFRKERNEGGGERENESGGVNVSDGGVSDGQGLDRKGPDREASDRGYPEGTAPARLEIDTKASTSDNLSSEGTDLDAPDSGATGKELQKSSALVQAAAVGWRPIGWAWNFLANEEAASGAAEAAAQRREALHEMEEEADLFGMLGSGQPLDLAFHLLLTGGDIRLRHVAPPAAKSQPDRPWTMSEEDDDSDAVVDKAVIEQTLSPPAGVFIPTTGLFSSLPDVRSPRSPPVSGTATETHFAVLQWEGLSLGADVAQEALRSCTVQLGWARLCKPRSSRGVAPSDVLLAILPPGDGSKPALQRQLFPAEEGGDPRKLPTSFAIRMDPHSAKGNTHSGRHMKGTEAEHLTALSQPANSSSSLSEPTPDVSMLKSSPAETAESQNDTFGDQQALRIIWQCRESSREQSENLVNKAPSLQVVIRRITAAYRPGLVDGLKRFLHSGREKGTEEEPGPTSAEGPAFENQRASLATERLLAQNPSGVVPPSGWARNSADHPPPDELKPDPGNPTLKPVTGGVFERMLALSAFEFVVSSCEFAALSCDAEMAPPAVILSSGAFICQLEESNSDSADGDERKAEREVKVVLQELQAHIAPDWTRRRESTLILDPVALTWTLSLPTEQSPKASVRKRTRVAASSSRFSLRLGGSEALCLAEIANAGLRDLSGSGVSVPLPAPNIYGGTWLTIGCHSASIETRLVDGSLTVGFRSLEAEALGSRVEFSAKELDEDCFRITSTSAASTEDLAVPQERHCTIAVGAAAVAFNQNTFHILRTLQSVDTPAQNKSEPAISSTREVPQANAPAPSAPLLGQFDTVDVNIATVQLTLADDGSEISRETPILVVPIVECSQLSMSVNRRLSDRSELGVSSSCTPLESGSPDQQVVTAEAIWRVESAEAKLQYTKEGTVIDLGAPLLHLARARGSVKEELGFQDLCLVKEKKLSSLQVGHLSGGVSRQQHVALLPFLKSFAAQPSHVSSQAAGHVGSNSEPRSHSSSDEEATCPTEASLRVAIEGVDLKLGLWTDGGDLQFPALETCESSVLRLVGSGLSWEDSTWLRKRADPSVRASAVGSYSGPLASVPSSSVPGDGRDSLERQRALNIAANDLTILLERKSSKRLWDGAEPACQSQIDPSSTIYPILERRPKDQKADTGPQIHIQWHSKGKQPGKLEVSLPELDWRLDAQLIQEIITVAYERRKHFPNPGGPDVLPAIPIVRIVALASRCYLLSAFEAFPRPRPTIKAVPVSPSLHKSDPLYSDHIHTAGFGALLVTESSVTLLSPSIDSDVRQWAGVHDSSEPLNPSVESRAQELDFSLLGFGLSLLEYTPQTLGRNPFQNPSHFSPQNHRQHPPHYLAQNPRPRSPENASKTPHQNPSQDCCQAPLPFLLPRDLRLGCTMVGCPFPLSLKLDARQLELAACGRRLSVLQGLFGALLGGWSATWPLRERCAGPVLPSDDLRCGLFRKALGRELALPGPGETCWGEGEGDGWIVWSYPYPRAVRHLVVDLRSLPPESIPLVFRLSYLAQPPSDPSPGGSIVDDSWSHCAAATPSTSHLLLEDDTNTSALTWRLSWQPATGEKSPVFRPQVENTFEGLPATVDSRPQISESLPGVPPVRLAAPSDLSDPPQPCVPSSNDPIGRDRGAVPRAVDLLRLVQVNPTLSPAISPRVPPLPVLAPLVFEVTADSLELGLLNRAECGQEEERGAVFVWSLRLGFHWWASTAMTVAVLGEWSGEYVDTACQTYERLVDPVECALVADICSALLPGTPHLPETDPPLNSASAAALLEGLCVGHPRNPPSWVGYSLDVQTKGDVRLRLQEALFEEAQRRYRGSSQKTGASSETGPGGGDSLSGGNERSWGEGKWLGENDLQLENETGGGKGAEPQLLGEKKGKGRLGEDDVGVCTLRSNPAIVLRNQSPVGLHVGQLGTDEAILIPAGGKVPYTWKLPPTLVPGAKKKLRVRIAAPFVDRAGVGSGGKSVPPASSWCEGFSVRASCGFVRRVGVEGRGYAPLVVKICKGGGGRWDVSVSGGLRFLNQTAGHLSIKYRGLLLGGASKAQGIESGVELLPAPGKDGKMTVDEDEYLMMTRVQQLKEGEAVLGGNGLKERASREGNARLWCSGERILTVPPTGAADVLLVMQQAGDIDDDVSDVGSGCQVAAVSVLLGSTAEQEEAQSEGAIWSPWLELVAPRDGEQAVQLLTFDTKSTPVRGVQRGLPSLWCQLAASMGGRLTVTVWPLFMAYNGLHRSVEMRVGEDGFESVSVLVKEREEVSLGSMTSGLDSVAFRLSQEVESSDGRENKASDEGNNASNSGVTDLNQLSTLGFKGQIVTEEEIQGGRSALDTGGGAWSAPLLLMAEASGLETGGFAGKSGSDRLGEAWRIPSAGAVRHLVLAGPSEGDKELGCVLASESYSSDVPTVVLSLLPYAVLHNATHHPVSIAAVGPRNAITPVAAAQPGGHVAFSWPSVDPSGVPRKVRRAKIGLSFGGNESAAEVGGWSADVASGGPKSGLDEGGGGRGFVWSSPVSLEEGGIHEGSVWVPARDFIAECCFLVRIEHVSHKALSTPGTPPGHVTCHVSIYPWALASNLTPYPLQLLPFHATYPGAPASDPLAWPAHILPGGEKESHVLVRRLVKEPPPELTPGLSSITYPSLSEAPTARVGLAARSLETVARSGWSQGPLRAPSRQPAGSLSGGESALGGGMQSDRSVHQLGLAFPSGPQVLSPPFRIDEPATQRRMTMTSSPGGHNVMLTYNVLIADGQAHLVLHEDVQPPAAVRNETDDVIEVRRAQDEDLERDGFSAVVGPCSVLHFDWRRAGDVGGGADMEEAMDEALLMQMKQEARDVRLQLQARNGPWSAPFGTQVASSFECALWGGQNVASEGETGSQRSDTQSALQQSHEEPPSFGGQRQGREGGEAGIGEADSKPQEAFQEARERLFVWVERRGATCCILVRSSEGATHTEPTPELALPSNLALRVSFDYLQVALFDDDSRLLRGPFPAAQPPPQTDPYVPALAFLFTLDGLLLEASKVTTRSPVDLPPVTSTRCHMAVAALQLDNHLPGAKLPVVLTADSGETGLGAATLRGHPSSKTDPFPAAQLSVTFCQPLATSPPILSASWLQNLDVRLQPLVLNFDDALLDIVTRLREPHPAPEPTASSAKSARHPQSQGLLVRTSDLVLADPQLYIHSLTVSDVRLVLTACVSSPIVLDVRAAPVCLSELELRTVLFSSAVLARGVLGHYVTEAICNVHRVVGSLELLFNPTGLVKSVRAGLRDLIQLPLQGGQSGPFGFLWGVGAGGVSLSRHVSRWTLTSLAGFSSSLSRILDRTYTEGGRLGGQSLPLSEDVGESGDGFTSASSTGLVPSPQKGSSPGGILSGVRRGLVGALVAPVSGALQLVAQTSSGLLGQGTGPQPRQMRASILRNNLAAGSEGVHEGDVEEEVEKGPPSRCTISRIQGHISAGEECLRHLKVDSLTVISTMGPTADVRPKSLVRGSLLLSDQAVYVLDYGGAISVARLPSKRLSLEEDHAAHEVVLVAEDVVSSFLGELSEGQVARVENVSVQVFARLDNETWISGLPVLKRVQD